MNLFIESQVVVWRVVHAASVAHAVPHVGYTVTMLLIEDSPTFTVLLQPAGSPVKRRSGRRGGPRSGRLMLPGGWDGRYEDRVWTRNTVRAHSRAQGYSVIRDWNSDALQYNGWYVNLEVPWVRTNIGFDSKDLVLDVSVSDDLSEYAYKDEDEFHWAQESGLLTSAEATLARSQALRAIEDLRLRRNLFDESVWLRWVPQLPTTPPRLPDRWTELQP